jgi:type IX secretion system PorP/SprF family membrane protein
MKKILLIAFLSVSVFNVMAQQQPVLSQYMLNNYYFNPAYTGSGELYNFSFLHRSQWSGYEDYRGSSGAPEIQLFTATANLDSTGHSFGFLLSRDKAAFITAVQAQVSYSYTVALTLESSLALGIRGGITTRSIDFEKYIVKHPDDEYVPDGKRSETRPDVTVGLWYNHKKYYAGISAKGIVAKADYNNLGIDNEKTIVVTAGYHIELQRDWRLTPAIQVVTNTERTYVQGSALLNHDDILWGGLAYRHDDAATLIAGFSMLEKKLRVSYAFDYTTGNRSVKAGTSHEVMVAFRLGKLHPKKRVPKVPAVAPEETKEAIPD